MVQCEDALINCRCCSVLLNQYPVIIPLKTRSSAIA